MGDAQSDGRGSDWFEWVGGQALRSGSPRSEGGTTLFCGGTKMFSHHAILAADALPPGDIDGDVDLLDRNVFACVRLGMNNDPVHIARSDLNGDGSADGCDESHFVDALIGG